MNNLPDRIKTHPDLNLAALKMHKHKELRLWYLLRTLTEGGSGKLEKKKAQKVLEGMMQYENFRVLILSGIGVFWGIFTNRKTGEEVIRLQGVPSVAFALGLEELVDPPIYIPIYAFEKLRRFKAFIYGTCFDNEGNPLSRATIRKATGLSIPTQVTYGKLAKFKTIKNICFVGPTTQDLTENQKEAGYFVTVSEGGLQTCKRMPNSYSCDLSRAPMGSMKRTNNWLSSRLRAKSADKECSGKPQRYVTVKSKPRYLRTTSYEGTQLWCMAS